MIAASSQSTSEVALVYDDFFTTYPQEYNDQPYPKDYIPPIFEKCIGGEGKSKEHTKQFIKNLGAHCNNKKFSYTSFYASRYMC